MLKKIVLYILMSGLILHANKHVYDDLTEGLNPDLSLIMDVSYVNRNLSDEEIKHLEIPGIAHGFLSAGTHDEHAHSINNSKNGFNLNYAELLISQEIGDILDVEAIFHFSSNKVEIDELYFSSYALGYGSKIKAGKFRSNFGYLNQYHHHSYKFSDMPLVYEAFLGAHGINEVGLQLQLEAPTEFELMFGLEVLQGENEQMFGNEAMSLPNPSGSSTELEVSGADAPSLFVAYVKSELEIKETHILLGLSYANGSTRQNHIDDEEPSAFSGDSSIYGADLLIKHHFSNHSVLTFQSEWLSRDMSGDSYSYNGASALVKALQDKKQSGYYTQLVYDFNENYNCGVRYDSIYENEVKNNSLNERLPEDMNKYSAMITYKPLEAAYFRLQYSHNNALYNESGLRQSVDTVTLQANITIGSHKSHSSHDEHH